ncbi:DUF4430 domain-containing protein [Anaerovoracaceae bacterium 41-7]|uniref:DUF4430 domain-containing protein n=1 Tax=Senimuribacter intestinalis TaxID=2941507 RepID=UPI0020419704|nr:DUF4430 domain-containing protein [Senimuribacter intestinalis]
MDKEFEKKVRMKRIRAAAVAIIVIAIAAYLIYDMDVEKADYGDSLQEQITAAQSLYDEQKVNAGNEEGQYAPYTLLAFAQQINKAKAVAEDEASEYNAEKDAYEQLKDDIKAFKKADNSDVVSVEDAEKLAKEKRSENYTVDFKKDKELSYVIAGENLKKPVTMNLTAQEEGPYYSQISEILAELSLQGQVVSFYQDGSFGGKISVTAPMYLEKETKAYAYKVDLEKGTLEYVSDAKLSKESQTATFSVSEGGDYVIVTKKMHKDGKKKKLDIEELEEEAQQDAESNDGKTGDKKGSSSSSNKNGNSSNDNPSDKPESKNITVSIEIRCDTLAQDLSKLENPALEAYVPSDGTILPTTKVTVKEGSTVFDVLNKVCRDKKIHVESSYTPAFGSYYIEGINYLYEFDGGNLSGWMYKVNGWFPNYGCSAYTLKDGDSIVWAYTCDLGEDVGCKLPE